MTAVTNGKGITEDQAAQDDQMAANNTAMPAYEAPEEKHWWQKALKDIGGWAYRNRALLTGIAVGIGCAAFGVATVGVGALVCAAGAFVASAAAQDIGDAINDKPITIGSTLDAAFIGEGGFGIVWTIKSMWPSGGLRGPAPPSVRGPRIILPNEPEGPRGPIYGPDGGILIP